MINYLMDKIDEDEVLGIIQQIDKEQTGEVDYQGQWTRNRPAKSTIKVSRQGTDRGSRLSRSVAKYQTGEVDYQGHSKRI